MPIHDLGYRPWEGRTTSPWTRWMPITQSGVKIAWQNAWMRRLLWAAWLPAFYFALGFFLYEQWLKRTADWITERLVAQNLIQPQEAEDSFKPLLTRALAGEAVEKLPFAQRAMVRMALATAQPQIDRLLREGRRQLDEMLPGVPKTLDRHTIWCWLMGMFFRYPQGMVMMLLVGMLAPPLAARDVSSKAFLLYFSRPIGWGDYLLGKLGVLWVYLGIISVGPALALYLFGVLLSPSLTVLEHTWDIPLRIAAATVVLVTPTSILALAFSSLTSRSWAAGFAWFAVWFFGYIGYQVIWLRTEWAERWDPSFSAASTEHWSLISFYHVLRTVQGWIFGLESKMVLVQASAAVLVALTAVSLVVLSRRISAPIRQ
ncbi:MAG TPA: ABC transporter permease subunit [Thermoguttaceae bacterium]|nr:ABC transporter permease subunit [Thermoguttaceae bacterium]